MSISKLVLGAAICVAILLPCATAEAQQATEQYVPIGRSPGLSGVRTWIGRIDAVDPETRSLRIVADDGPHTVYLSERTHIWLDRSADGLTNLVGSYRDCTPGRTAEVHLDEHEKAPTAAWIKLR